MYAESYSAMHGKCPDSGHRVMPRRFDLHFKSDPPRDFLRYGRHAARHIRRCEGSLGNHLPRFRARTGLRTGRPSYGDPRADGVVLEGRSGRRALADEASTKRASTMSNSHLPAESSIRPGPNSLPTAIGTSNRVASSCSKIRSRPSTGCAQSPSALGSLPTDPKRCSAGRSSVSTWPAILM